MLLLMVVSWSINEKLVSRACCDECVVSLELDPNGNVCNTRVNPDTSDGTFFS